jgi:hypothetical protein
MSRRIGSIALSAALLALTPGYAQAQQRDATQFTLRLSGDGDAIVRADTGEVLCRPTQRGPACMISVRQGETVPLLAREKPGASSFAIWQGPCAREPVQYSPQCRITGGGPAVTMVAHFGAAGAEASAISSLRTLVSSQAMFYQGDVERDGDCDNATELRSLDSYEMVDDVLGDGDAGASEPGTQHRPQPATRRPSPR